MPVTFRIERSADRYTIGGVVLPCLESYAAAQASVIRLTIDTGATSTIIPISALRGVPARRDGVVRVADGRQVAVVRARVHLLLGGGSITADVLAIEDRDHDEGLIGIDLLRRIDLNGGSATITLAHTDLGAEEPLPPTVLGRAVDGLVAALERRAMPACLCEPVLRRSAPKSPWKSRQTA
mgnify:CR=1 FL=1